MESNKLPPSIVETLYIIAAVCLFATGHWIGGAVLLGCAAYSEAVERRKKRQQSNANLPSDESGEAREEQLPSISVPKEQPQTSDHWKAD